MNPKHKEGLKKNLFIQDHVITRLNTEAWHALVSSGLLHLFKCLNVGVGQKTTWEG